MLEQGIFGHLAMLHLTKFDEDMAIKQLLVDATLIACKIQERHSEGLVNSTHANDNDVR